MNPLIVIGRTLLNTVMAKITLRVRQQTKTQQAGILISRL